MVFTQRRTPAGLIGTVAGGHVSLGLRVVSDHRGSNSQAIDFESVKTYPIFTAKNENHGKSNT
jgi:hypothetical protein